MLLENGSVERRIYYSSIIRKTERERMNLSWQTDYHLDSETNKDNLMFDNGSDAATTEILCMFVQNINLMPLHTAMIILIGDSMPIHFLLHCIRGLRLGSVFCTCQIM